LIGRQHDIKITNILADKYYGKKSLSDGYLDKSLHLKHWYDFSSRSVDKLRLTFPSPINIKFF